MKPLIIKIPVRSLGIKAPTVDCIRYMKEELDKMDKATNEGHNLWIRLDWGVVVDSMNKDPYLTRTE